MVQRATGFILLLALVACSGTLHAELVGHWALDDGDGNTAADSSGNGYDGTLIGDLVWIPGQIGGALEFNDEAYVDCTNDAGLDVTGPFSATIWIRPGTEGNVETAPLAKASSSAGWSWQLRYGWGSGGKPTIMGWQFNATGGTKWIWVQDELPVDEWHHIAAAHDGATVRCYLDGVETDSQPMTGFASTASSFLIGSDGWRSDWIGAVDDVRLYDHGLLEEEIQDIMRGRAAGVAYNPNPDDQIEDVLRDSTLSWTPGEFADTHTVYLGSNWDDVNDGAAETLLAQGLETNSIDPGRLTLGATYYWRVDEVNAPPDNGIYKGDVWSFQVEPTSYAIPIGAVQATASSIDGVQDPSNAVNGSGLNENDEHSSLLKDMWSSDTADLSPWIQFDFDQVQPLDKVHIWNHNSQTEGILGFGIKEALIEYSLDGETWMEFATVELAQSSGAPTDTGFDVALDGIVAKAVRINGLSNYSILGLPQRGLSEVRFYAVPLRARLEVPADGTADLDPRVDLSWRPGREAVQHEVLIGTDPENLALVATVDDPAYTAIVDLDSTVYWQINEVNEAADPSLWEGNLWSFDTAEFITVDDMESYKSRDGSYVWETWTDGFGDDNNGALLGHNGDDMETTIFYDGKQSLPYYYGQGSATSSEAFRDIDRDWGQHGIESVSLMFYGSTSGIAGDMYLKVNDEKIATYPTSADLTVEDWHNWTVDLPAAALGQVDTLAIGFEGGTGWVFIDAIRLYPEASE